MNERLKRNSNSKKTKIFDAIEKLKKVRSGESNVLDEIKDEKNVYDYVSEDEYTNIIEKRRKDWIVDDDGNYFEDGREIFDAEDEYNDEEKINAEYNDYDSNKKKKVPLKRLKEKCDKVLINNSGIKNFLISNQRKSVPKKSFDQINVDDDFLKGILDDIIQDSSEINKKDFISSNSSSTLNQNNKRKHSYLDDNSTTTNNPFSIKSFDGSVKKKIKCEPNFEDEHLLNISDDFNFDLENSIQLNESKHQNINEDCDVKIKIENLDISYSKKAENEDSFKILERKNSSFLNFQINELDSNELFKIDKKNNKILNFYWIDMYEDVKQPGTIYMFGKVFIENLRTYVSCCVIAKNVEHKVFVFPRTNFKSDENRTVTIQDVYDEMKDIFSKYKIKNFRSKFSLKFYSFEKEIPSKGEYLEILYTATSHLLPKDLSGDTFDYVFGLNQNCLERLILDLKLKGPCWLEVFEPKNSSPPISWCKLEFFIEKPFNQIKISEKQETEVPLSFIAFNIRTYINEKTKNNEIVSISCLCNHEYFVSKNNDKNSPKIDLSFCIISKPSNLSQTVLPNDLKNDKSYQANKKTKIEFVNSERELLNIFVAKFIQIDPDFLIGHDFLSIDLNVLFSRIAHFKLAVWSKLGRLRRSSNISLLANERNIVTVGRLLCDTIVAARELIKAKSYDLTELTHHVLKKSRYEYDQVSFSFYYESTKNLLKFIEDSMLDTHYILGIFLELNVMPLYMQITKISGNLLSRTLLGGRSERNEFLLLHAFNEKNYILPDKKFNFKISKQQLDVSEVDFKRKKSAYVGGLVLDPKIGFYDKYVLLMDFNSLYPSIIQEYNICFTSVNRKSFLESLLDATGEILPELPNNEVKTGILPIEIAKLVESRRQTKKLLCDINVKPDVKIQLDIKQKALKLTANSMYGCLGFSNSRFYAKPLAALITAKGREILNNTKNLAESLGLDVIYGDTDSIMINTNSSNYYEARSIGTKLQIEINKKYKLLEIEIDGIFRSILLLKKKKYAAVLAIEKNNKLTYETEVKGLDIVRRDWSNVAKKVGENVLTEILSFDKSSEVILDNIHNYLSSIAKQIQENTLPINSYVISKQLTRNPEDYPDKKNLSHVLVALRCNEAKKTSRFYKAGDTISYVICVNKENKDNFNNLPSTQRAFNIEEIKNNKDYEIDKKYYLQQQIHPIVSRLCDPIDGTNSQIISEFLGIEVSQAKTSKDDDYYCEFLSRSDEFKYDICKSLAFKCPNIDCKQEFQFRNLINMKKTDVNQSKRECQKFELSFEKCSKCSAEFSDEKYLTYFINNFKLYINSMIKDYYNCWYICEDPICKYKTKCFTSTMSKKGPSCPECKISILYPEISNIQLYVQFCFFLEILDVKKIKNNFFKLETEETKCLDIRFKKMEKLYDLLYTVIHEYKSMMAYDNVDLNYLFANQYFSCVKDFH